MKLIHKTDHARKPGVPYCRPEPTLGFALASFGLIFVSFAVSIWQDPKLARPDEMLVAIGIAIVVLLACLTGGLWIVRARAIAGPDGLRWRSLGRWRILPWEAVTDFYKLERQRDTLHIIEAGARTLRMGTAWAIPDAFRDEVAARALNTRARTWDLKGIRPEDDRPLTLDYNTAENRQLRRSIVLLGGLLAVVLFGVFVPRAVRAIHDIGWEMGLAFAGWLLLVIACQGLMLLAALPRIQDLRRRKNQRVTLTLQSIAFEDDDRRVAASWAQVQSVRRTTLPGWVTVPGRWEVETDNGAFDFTFAIRDRALILRMLERHAPEALRRGRLESPDEGDLAPGPQIDPSGARVYHYRNRAVRALLLGLTAFFLLLPLSRLLNAAGLEAGEACPIPLIAASFMIVIYAWWRYRAGGIKLDEAGITLQTPFGPRHMRWEEIQETRLKCPETAMGSWVRGRGKTIRINGALTNVGDLVTRIRDRVA